MRKFGRLAHDVLVANAVPSPCRPWRADPIHQTAGAKGRRRPDERQPDHRSVLSPRERCRRVPDAQPEADHHGGRQGRDRLAQGPRQGRADDGDRPIHRQGGADLDAAPRQRFPRRQGLHPGDPQGEDPRRDHRRHRGLRRLRQPPRLRFAGDGGEARRPARDAPHAGHQRALPAHDDPLRCRLRRWNAGPPAAHPERSPRSRAARGGEDGGAPEARPRREAPPCGARSERRARPGRAGATPADPRGSQAVRLRANERSGARKGIRPFSFSFSGRHGACK